jgi:hypothetical protein
MLMIQAAAPAQGLDFSNLTLIYEEDFEGEAGFPTLPEVNLLAIGDTSSVGVDGASQPFDPPFISDGAAIGSIHSEVPPSGQNVHVPSTFSDSFGIRGIFDHFSIGTAPADGSAAAGVVAPFGTLPNPTSVIGAAVLVSRNFGTITGLVSLRYSEPPADPIFSSNPLSPAATSALLDGASFMVDMIFDKNSMVATASVDIAGVGVIAAPPLDVSAVAGITSSTPVAATNLSFQEGFGLDTDVRMEEISVFISTTLIGDQIRIERNLKSTGTLQSDLVIVAQGSLEVSCPGAFDLCGATIPGTTRGNFNVESKSLTLNVGIAGGSSSFADDAFNGYTFSDLDLGVPITSIALTTDIPGLTAGNVLVLESSVGVDLSGLTVDPGQFFTIELNPTTTPQAVPALSNWAVLALVGIFLVSARRWVTSTRSPECSD